VNGAALGALRRSFDDAFARPPDERAVDAEELLMIRIAGDPYAVRAREMSGLTPGGRIVPVPGPLPELLGITAIKGGLVPAFSLGALLGYPQARELPSWLLLCGGDQDRVALGVERFDRYTRVPRADISVAEDLRDRPHVPELARTEAGICGVIDVRSVLEAIRRRIAGAGRKKE